MATIRTSVASWCRETRAALDVTLQELADAVGISRSHLAAIEAGTANPTLDVIDRLGRALDTDFELRARVPILIGGGPTERDAVHGWCSGDVDRRLRGHGFVTAGTGAWLPRQWSTWAGRRPGRSHGC